MSEPFRISMTRGLGGSRDQPCKPGRFYVYVHKDAQGKIFYVGKGTGDRAESRDRGADWSHYVERILGGKYEVEIIRDGISEEDALQVEDAVMAEHAATIINRQNFHAPVETAELFTYSDAMKAYSQAFNAAVEFEKAGAVDEAARSYEASYGHYVRAMGHNYDRSARQQLSLPAIGPNQTVTRYTSLLAKQGKHQRVVEFTEQYFRDFATVAENTIVAAIRKRMERSKKELAKAGGSSS